MRLRASPRETPAGNADSARGHRRRTGFALALPVALALLLVPAAVGASAPLGHPAMSFAGAGPDPTASDEQSKIWFNDGEWWAVMWKPVNRDFHIFRFQQAAGWVDTGTAVDDRSQTRSDVLWDGSRLYVVSHKFSLRSGLDSPTRLYRLSYDTSSRTYSMDDGFPVVVNTHRPRVVVLDKDSKGQLWVTWTHGGRVYVNGTLCDPACDDRRWGTPFSPRVARARVAANDVAAVVAFGADRIGLMWSNQLERSFSFAVHVDGRPPGVWTQAEVIPGISADDHISLKADGEGRVVAMVKTTTNAPGDPLNVLLVRDAETGAWSQAVFGLRRDKHTRAVVVVDQQHDSARVFASAPTASDPESLAVYEKVTPLSNPAFVDGPGRVVMARQNRSIGNPTSAKHPVTKATGLLVLATEARTKQYWFDYSRRLGAPASTGSILAGGGEPESSSSPAATAPDEAGDGNFLALAAVASAGAGLIGAVIVAVAVRQRRRRIAAWTPEPVRVHTARVRGKRERELEGTGGLPRVRQGYDVAATDRLFQRLSAEYEAARAAEVELRTVTETLRAELERARSGDTGAAAGQETAQAVETELRAEIDALRTELEWERSGNAEARTRSEAARAAEAASRAELEGLRAELQRGRIDQTALQARYESARAAEAALRAEVERLNGDLQRERSGDTELQARYDAAQAAEAALRSELETLRTELEAERAGSSEVRAWHEAAQAAENELRNDLDALRTELEAERAGASEARARIEAAQAVESELRAELDALRGELESERTTAAEARTRYVAVEAGEDALRAEVEHLHAELERERTENADRQARDEAAHAVEAELGARIETLERELEEARSHTAAEAGEPDEQREHGRELVRDRDALEAEVDALRAYRREIERDRDRLESELEALREHYRELKQEREAREAEVEGLRAQSRDLAGEHDALAGRVEALTTQRSNLERDQEHLAAQLESLRSLTEEAHARLSDLSSALTALKLDSDGVEQTAEHSDVG